MLLFVLLHKCPYFSYFYTSTACEHFYHLVTQCRGKSRRTHAVVASVDLHVVHRADAGVVSDGVVALARAADARLLTLIDVCPQ